MNKTSFIIAGIIVGLMTTSAGITVSSVMAQQVTTPPVGNGSTIADQIYGAIDGAVAGMPGDSHDHIHDLIKHGGDDNNHHHHHHDNDDD